MSTAMARRGKMATVVLTGNPGSPGVPSGPCDITETKQVVKEQHFHRQQECCNFRAHSLPAPSKGLSMFPQIHFAEEGAETQEGKEPCRVTPLVSNRARNCAQAARVPTPQNHNSLHCKWKLSPL